MTKTRFRRHPKWAIVASLVAAVMVGVTWQKAFALTPNYRGVLLGCVFWCMVVTLWELLVPLVAVKDGALVVRPGLFMGKQVVPLRSLHDVEVGERTIRLGFADRESFSLPKRRLAPVDLPGFLAFVRARVSKTKASDDAAKRPGKRKRWR